MEIWLQAETWIGLLTLLSLEIVLGIDNVIIISILAGRLPQEQRAKARRVGLGMAVITRIMLLFSISWLIHLTDPLFSVLGNEISGRDLVLIAGGLFLIAKSVHEIDAAMAGSTHGDSEVRAAATFFGVIAQIIMMDIIFSFDSVITAVGMVSHIPVMIVAVIIAAIIMMTFAGTISAFVERNPTIKMLALSFLILIGVALITDGFDQHISKGYIYFAMAFSLAVEFLNMRVRLKNPEPLHLRGAKMPEQA